MKVDNKEILTKIINDKIQMEFKQSHNNTWTRTEVKNKDSTKWIIVTKTGRVIESVNPLSVPCNTPVTELQYLSGIIPYFVAEPLLSWGYGPVREGYYFDWFDKEWCEYFDRRDDDKNTLDATYNRFMKRLDHEHEEQWKSRIVQLEERVQCLEKSVFK